MQVRAGMTPAALPEAGLAAIARVLDPPLTVVTTAAAGQRARAADRP
ncbi:MAG TPA: hypothetical protein VFV41_16230 [Streptosporangiaceae bacterium]|nr:hypothetical protein [Streptosporangiaceae bacterium]